MQSHSKIYRSPEGVFQSFPVGVFPVCPQVLDSLPSGTPYNEWEYRDEGRTIWVNPVTKYA